MQMAGQKLGSSHGEKIILQLDVVQNAKECHQ